MFWIQSVIYSLKLEQFLDKNRGTTDQRREKQDEELDQVYIQTLFDTYCHGHILVETSIDEI